MRCIGCGIATSRTNPGVTGAGFVLCGVCISDFAALSEGRLPQRRGTGPLWGVGLIDASAVDEMPEEQVRFELAVVRDLAAPFNAFIEAAQLRLGVEDSAGRNTAPGPHCHCDSIALPDGTLIRASSFLSQFDENDRPAFGVYLDPAWNPSWPHMRIDWPDFDLPASRESVRAAVTDVLRRARGGELVEIGCLGGHGRTGTFLAVLAIAAGEPAASAVAWVRNHYCHDAVETDEQAAYAESF